MCCCCRFSVFAWLRRPPGEYAARGVPLRSGSTVAAAIVGRSRFRSDLSNLPIGPDSRFRVRVEESPAGCVPRPRTPAGISGSPIDRRATRDPAVRSAIPRGHPAAPTTTGRFLSLICSWLSIGRALIVARSSEASSSELFTRGDRARHRRPISRRRRRRLIYYCKETTGIGRLQLLL